MFDLSNLIIITLRETLMAMYGLNQVCWTETHDLGNIFFIAFEDNLRTDN